MKRTAVCKVTDVPVNGLKEFESNGTKVCVVNAGDRFFICQAACPHEGIALCDGVFEGDTLTCLEHLWQWNLSEGGEPCGLAEAPIKMYPVEVDADTVYLKG